MTVVLFPWQRIDTSAKYTVEQVIKILLSEVTWTWLFGAQHSLKSRYTIDLKLSGVFGS